MAMFHRMRHSTFWSTKGLETTIPGAEMVKWTDEENRLLRPRKRPL